MIRNELYIKYSYEIGSLAKKLEDALDSLPGCSDEETMEETKIRYAIHRAAEALRDAKDDIEYFSKPVKEGKLAKAENDRFILLDKNNKELREFHCGYSIEVYLKKDKDNNIEAGWYAGRVEYDWQRDGYYFFGANKPMIYEGMKARIRA